MHIENRKIGLDVLRSLAIHLVVFGHAATLFNPMINIPYLGRIIGKSLAVSEILAYLGVELFFVLSGFLISKILLESFDKKIIDFNILKTFWIRRWLRTLPNYYWILLINIIVYIFIYKKYTFDWKYIFFFQNLFSTHPHFFREAWSLAVEEWYYLIFPIVILFILRIIKKLKNAFLLAIVLLIFISIIFKIILIDNTIPHNFDEDVRKIVLFRMDSIAIGALASLILYYYKNIFLKYKNTLLIFSILLFILFLNLFYIIYDNNYELYLQNNFIRILIDYGFSPIFAIIFAFIFPYFYQIKNIKIGTSFIIFTSKISYSMYLIHLLIYFPMFYYNQWFPKTIEESILYVIIYYTLVYILSYINYLLIEKTFLKYRDTKFAN